MSVRLSSCLAWERVLDKLASLSMHERVQKSSSLASQLYEGRGDLRVHSPRSASDGPYLDVGRRRIPGLIVLESDSVLRPM